MRLPRVPIADLGPVRASAASSPRLPSPHIAVMVLLRNEVGRDHAQGDGGADATRASDGTG